MDLHYIDYVSVARKSWLHNLPAGTKMLGFVGIVALLLASTSIYIEVGVAVGILGMAIFARVPMKIFLGLALYPVFFLFVLYLSIEGETLSTALFLGFRVLAVTESAILLLLSTSFPSIFKVLGRVLPDFLVAALFFSYRSIFVLSDSMSDVQTAMHLRGGFSKKRPLWTIRHFGTAIGHFLVHSIDSSQRMADGLRLRGFKNRVYY